MSDTPSSDSSWLTIKLTGAVSEPAPDDEPSARGLRLDTTRGPIHCLFHSPDLQPSAAVLWATGARGGFHGPASGLYAQMAADLAASGIASLRPAYRQPAHLDESTLDMLAAVAHLEDLGVTRIALVGHSFGGGVAIATARYTRTVSAVAVLASQTDGAEDVVLMRSRPLLIVHGEDDTVLPADNADVIYNWAFEPKEKVVYPGAGHGLRECREDLRRLLLDWLPPRLQME